MIFVVLISQDQNPGPQYKNRSTLGPKNAPAFGFGSSKAHDADSQVFISATHAKENQGADGPGPGAYSAGNAWKTGPKFSMASSRAKDDSAIAARAAPSSCEPSSCKSSREGGRRERQT